MLSVMSQRVVVVGAGISGLSAAYRLTELAPELDVVVLERSDRAGGLIKTDVIDDFVVEQGPDSILTEKPQALALARRLGLESELLPTNTRDRGAFVVTRGRLERIPEGFSMMAATRALPILRSPILSRAGKLRLMAEVALPRRKAEDDESISSFVRRRFGPEVLARLAQPLMSGIYGSDPAELSLRSTMPRFVELERAHRSVTLGLLAKRRTSTQSSGVRYGMFVAFKQGNQTLTDVLQRRLGSRLRLHSPVAGVTRQGAQYRVQIEGADALLADAVILATPARIMAPALEVLDERLSELLGGVRFGSTATVAYGFRDDAIVHPLNGFGFVVPSVEKRRILASTWASKKFAGRAPPGKVLLRAFFGGAHDESAPHLADSELIDLGISELDSLLGLKQEPLFTSVARQIQAMPKYVVGHGERVAAIEARLSQFPGLALAGNSLYGVGIPDAIGAGERAAETIAQRLS